ncbi:MAG: Omp28-related outer membrane protein, partial [Saprospiraceae bacterium]
MTKRLLLFTVALFSFFSVQAQDAPEVQNSLISKITATWCPPCGGWGWDFFHELEDDNSDKALVIAVHHSNSQLETPTSSALTDNFNTNSQPRFIFNNQDQGALPSNSADKRIDIQNMVNTNNASSPVVNTGLQAFHDMDNNTITVKTKSKFFQEADGEYYLGVYVIEDDVEAPQAPSNNITMHSNVLRTGLSTDHFGVALASGTIAVDTETELEFSIDINSDWNMENVTMASIIWKSENGAYTFVNTNS